MNNNAMLSVSVKVENQNKPATKKQLWALFAASRKHGASHDYRNDNLTMLQASELLQKFNAQSVIAKIGVTTPTTTTKVVTKRKKPTLEQEFVSYIESKMPSIIAECRNELGIKSIVEDDPKFFPNPKDRKQYAFFGCGCGISIINYDKRSKVGKQIMEYSSKHHYTTFYDMFAKGFTQKEIAYYKSVGFPLSAMFAQNIHIGARYTQLVATFMESKGVKKVFVRTFDD